MKVVINDCHGGFGLSNEAFEELIKLGWTVTDYGKDGEVTDKEADIIKSKNDSFEKYYLNNWSEDDPKFRTNKDLIAVVEKLGKKVNWTCSDLKVIEIPDDVDFVIQEYDGAEWAAEKHRTWG